MPNLPVEIWLEIGSQICIKQKELLSLVVVDRLFYSIFIQKLYANLYILLPSPEDLSKSSSEPSKFSSARRAEQALLEKLESDLQLRGYVYECHVKGAKYPSITLNENASNHPYEEHTASIMTLIGSLPNLKTIRLTSLSLHQKWVIYLASQPSLRLTIHTSNCITYGETEENGPYTAVELSVRYVHGHYIGRIAFGGSLQHLSLPNMATGSLLGLFTSFKSPVLQSLRSLKLCNFHPNLNMFLRNTPSLITLHFNSYNPVLGINPEGWNEIVPKLESFSGHEQLIPLLVVGRPIKLLEIWDLDGERPALELLGKNFGSTVPLDKVTLGCSRDLDDKVNYVTTNCPQVQELRIKDILRAPLKKKEIMTSFLKILNLKELKKLYFPHTQYFVTEDEWKREQFEALRAEGCKDIVQISFGAEVWTRHAGDSSWKLLVD